MKKKFVIASIVLFAVLLVLYFYGYKKVNTKKDTKKNSDFSLKSIVSYIEEDDNYILTTKYYKVKVEATKTMITLSFENDQHKGQLIGTLKDDVLSFKIANDDKNALLKASLLYSVVDGLGQINGNDKGYVSALLGEYNLKDATLDKDGIELISEEDTNIYQFKVNKKFDLGNIEESYFKVSDIEDVKEMFSNEKYIQKTKGNILLYKDTDFYKNNILYICEPNELTTRSYNSLLSVIELVYGVEYMNKFKESYKQLSTNKVLDKFDITMNYRPTDQEALKKIVTDNYKILKVVYKK